MKCPITYTPLPADCIGARMGRVYEILRTPIVVTCVFSTR